MNSIPDNINLKIEEFKNRLYNNNGYTDEERNRIYKTLKQIVIPQIGDSGYDFDEFYRIIEAFDDIYNGYSHIEMFGIVTPENAKTTEEIKISLTRQRQPYPRPQNMNFKKSFYKSFILGFNFNDIPIQPQLLEEKNISNTDILAKFDELDRQIGKYSPNSFLHFPEYKIDYLGYPFSSDKSLDGFPVKSNNSIYDISNSCLCLNKIKIIKFLNSGKDTSAFEIKYIDKTGAEIDAVMKLTTFGGYQSKNEWLKNIYIYNLIKNEPYIPKYYYYCVCVGSNSDTQVGIIIGEKLKYTVRNLLTNFDGNKITHLDYLIFKTPEEIFNEYENIYNKYYKLFIPLKNAINEMHDKYNLHIGDVLINDGNIMVNTEDIDKLDMIYIVDLGIISEIQNKHGQTEYITDYNLYILYKINIYLDYEGSKYFIVKREIFYPYYLYKTEKITKEQAIDYLFKFKSNLEIINDDKINIEKYNDFIKTTYLDNGYDPSLINFSIGHYKSY